MEVYEGLKRGRGGLFSEAGEYSVERNRFAGVGRGRRGAPEDKPPSEYMAEAVNFASAGRGVGFTPSLKNLSACFQITLVDFKKIRRFF